MQRSSCGLVLAALAVVLAQTVVADPMEGANPGKYVSIEAFYPASRALGKIGLTYRGSTIKGGTVKVASPFYLKTHGFPNIRKDDLLSIVQFSTGRWRLTTKPDRRFSVPVTAGSLIKATDLIEAMGLRPLRSPGDFKLWDKVDTTVTDASKLRFGAKGAWDWLKANDKVQVHSWQADCWLLRASIKGQWQELGVQVGYYHMPVNYYEWIFNLADYYPRNVRAEHVNGQEFLAKIGLDVRRYTTAWHRRGTKMDVTLSDGKRWQKRGWAKAKKGDKATIESLGNSKFKVTRPQRRG